MTGRNKNQEDILAKLGITALNPMQEKAHDAISNHPNTVLLSPTGTGKTLAFLLPIVPMLDPSLEQIQALILVPSRELAIQIEQVVREMGKLIQGGGGGQAYFATAGGKKPEGIEQALTKGKDFIVRIKEIDQSEKEYKIDYTFG